MIDNQTLVEEIGGNFGDKIKQVEENFQLLSFTINAEDLLEIVSFLKDSLKLKFNFLTDVTGIHFPNEKGAELCSTYLLHSWENGIRLRLKVYLPIEKPEVPTLVSLYPAANWMEREAFDFFGIIYVGHPNLTRILNMEDMDYHPLRKEYALEDPTRRDKIDELFGR